VSAEFLVFPPVAIFPSDLLEFNLVSGVKKRTGALPKFNVPEQTKKARKPSSLSIFLKRMARWLSPKFPHGSGQRRAARTLVSLLPRYFRNQIISSLAPAFTHNSQSLQNIGYSMDQGFGMPTSAEPLVTIVIPVYNNWWVTYRCMRALQSNSDHTPYEIIVIDDASTDQTIEALKSIRGITVVRNLTNVGYLMSTNRGAAQASATSKYVVLLNNDTEPIDGWLDSLYSSMQNDQTIAILGSALIYPNGMLQEAGCQIFSGGNAWNLGRGGDPLNSLFTFTREVDYCSAASVMVRKTFWLDVEGFDTRYLPAYCEDSDLALAAWTKGHRVMYEPKSWVIHHEGLSHGKSTNSGLKKYQVTNTRKFFAKWEPILRNHWEDIGIPRFEATRDSKGIVVVCDRQLPSITRDSGSIRTTQIIKHIQALGFHVVLVCMDNSTTSLDIDLLQSRGVEVHQDIEDFYATITWRRNRVRAIWTIRREVYEFFGERLKQISPSAIFIADLLDIEYREAYEPKSGISKNQLKILDEVDHIVLVSDTEATEFNAQTKSDRTRVVWAEFEPQASEVDWVNSQGLIFVGGFRHLPNLVGLQWFADSVLPLLSEMGFSAPIRIIGSGLTSQKKTEFENKGLQILGGLDNIAEYYLQSRVAIVPLQNGAGRKGKIGEALSFGIPIVSTNVGVEGFINLDNSGIVIANDPMGMALAIFNLHEKFELWSHASSLGKDYCSSNLSSHAMKEQILKLLSRT
jgi:GT2 family glycosyltransferase/glycosyltransferase involved in cell wall biosynthesis